MMLNPQRQRGFAGAFGPGGNYAPSVPSAPSGIPVQWIDYLTATTGQLFGFLTTREYLKAGYNPQPQPFGVSSNLLILGVLGVAAVVMLKGN